MTFSSRRQKLRAILSGPGCVRPGSVYDAISIRIAEDLGFELGMFGGSVASLAILGDPDIALITLTELAEQMRRMSRASKLPVLVDADHGYGNALNVRRTVQELEIGVLLAERRDRSQGALLRDWLDGHVLPLFRTNFFLHSDDPSRAGARAHA